MNNQLYATIIRFDVDLHSSAAVVKSDTTIISITNTLSISSVINVNIILKHAIMGVDPQKKVGGSDRGRWVPFLPFLPFPYPTPPLPPLSLEVGPLNPARESGGAL